jgi:hypothetical protein
VRDVYPTVRAAAVQAAAVFLDRERTTAKACELIREAGRNGARIIGFPEGFIPAHPVWFRFHPGTGRVATQLSVELFKNAVEIPGPEIDELRRAAAEAEAYVVVGVCEKQPNTIGTLYNSQVFLGPSGEYLGKHQKLMPTVGERLVHAGWPRRLDARLPDGVRPGQRAHMRRELEPPRGVRDDRPALARPRDELAEPLPNDRRPARHASRHWGFGGPLGHRRSARALPTPRGDPPAPCMPCPRHRSAREVHEPGRPPLAAPGAECPFARIAAAHGGRH